MNNVSVYNGKGSEIMPTLVYENEKGVDVTTSLIVAQVFGKEHKHVLRDIDSLSCSEIFRQSNFGLSFKNRELPNGGSKQERYYTMTKDGFSFLVMGYTGEKAGEFKERFINEFNRREAMLKSDDYILMRSMQILQKRIQAIEADNARLLAENEANAETIRQQAPKVQYVDAVLQSVNTYSANLIAKEMGMSAETLNRRLKEKGVIYKQGGVWVLTAKYQGKGYTKTRTHAYTRSDGSQGTSMLTVWTETGRAFLHSIFQQ